MSKPRKLSARLPRGFADQAASDLAAIERMAGIIKRVYVSYGFEQVETPLIEYTDALGKYLPDQDQPNEGVFSFQDDDEQWLSLRYDLTAPLARYVAEHYDSLPKPYRSLRYGPVFRNEKPGPGRFRQFLQFDADTVGSSSPASDAEMCMMMADTMEALGLKRGDYVIKVSSRKILDGLMSAIGLGGAENAGRRLGVMRAIDKLDRLGEQGVRALLGAGRKDESGDFTKGAGLSDEHAARVLALLKAGGNSNAATLDIIAAQLPGEASNELRQIAELCEAAGYDTTRISVDPSIVRGLEYYTGAVFEAQLTFPVQNEKGETVVFGSVAGGGRYDGLVARFRGEEIPATGFSIGLSRLLSALKARGLASSEAPRRAPAVVATALGMPQGEALRLARILREAGIAAEIYLGSSGKLGNQLTYAAKRGSPCVIIQGDDERAKGEAIVRDMAAGSQQAVPEATLTEAVRRLVENS